MKMRTPTAGGIVTAGPNLQRFAATVGMSASEAFEHFGLDRVPDVEALALEMVFDGQQAVSKLTPALAAVTPEEIAVGLQLGSDTDDPEWRRQLAEARGTTAAVETSRRREVVPSRAMEDAVADQMGPRQRAALDAWRQKQ